MSTWFGGLVAWAPLDHARLETYVQGVRPDWSGRADAEALRHRRDRRAPANEAYLSRSRSGRDPDLHVRLGISPDAGGRRLGEPAVGRQPNRRSDAGFGAGTLDYAGQRVVVGEQAFSNVTYDACAGKRLARG